MNHTTPLTFDACRDEVYLSWDGTRFTWQSNRHGDFCDESGIMNTDTSDGKPRATHIYLAHCVE